MHHTTGLKEIILAADVFSDVTTNQVMAGKHFNRGVRLHKLIYEAVSCHKMVALGDWLSGKGDDDTLIEMDEMESAAESTQRLRRNLIQQLSPFCASYVVIYLCTEVR